ncbi:hypothetical protein GGF41_002574 [Coemansia sp. RSA 2531]|nr:hypothetical protein GGF41_002574 [Coemansia sp. RSA 2531]
MSMSFPFDDDVLFRGNSATLKHLSIPLDQNTVYVLNRTRALNGLYNNLRISISRNCRTDDLSLVTRADMNKCIGSLVRAAQTLKLAYWMPFRYFIDEAPINGFEGLQSLYMSWDNWAFLDVLSLLKVLPNLVKLSCGFAGLRLEHDIAAEDLPDYVSSKYCNTGKRLQIWYPIDPRMNQRISIPEYAMLMALACPKLRRVELAPHNIAAFQTKFAEALGKEPYSKYASQLNHLLHAAY